MTLLELKDVRKSYRQGGFFGNREAVGVLNGVDLRIEAGRCLGLLGASGCGKSTTGRIALGLERPDSGQVLYHGREIGALTGEDRRAWRRNCQVVFQNSHGAVNPRHRAWEIITEPLSNFEPAPPAALRDRAVESLNRVGLPPDALDKRPHQFSGGELQRICIARALILKPAFILLDEAVSALDLLSQSRVLDLLAELKAESGAAFLFISHDLRVLLKMCDSLAVMTGGRISSFVGDLAELENPGAEFDPTFQALAEAVLPAEPAG